jgi:hypothetical protein
MPNQRVDIAVRIGRDSTATDVLGSGESDEVWRKPSVYRLARRDSAA